VIAGSPQKNLARSHGSPLASDKHAHEGPGGGQVFALDCLRPFLDHVQSSAASWILRAEDRYRCALGATPLRE
jgi:hypothetical protein